LTNNDGTTTPVAIKILRGLHTDPEVLYAATKRLNRESQVWHLLSHPNVLPFLGICTGIGPSPALISPICDIGNVMNYIQMDVDVDRLKIILEAARGLEYLHSVDVIHGDFKSSNVLIDDEGTARICDFGRSRLIDHRGFTTDLIGSSRLMAPELLSPPEVEDEELQNLQGLLTKETDVYAFSMVALEISTGKQPFYYIRSDSLVILKVQQGMRPRREDPPNSHLWQILEACWSTHPGARPAMAAVVKLVSREI